MATGNRRSAAAVARNTTFPVLAALHRAVHAVQEAVHDAKLDVTHPEAVVLAHLSTLGEAKMSELHRAFGYRKSTVTNVVDRLVMRGLAARHPDPADGRSYILRPTAAGTRVGRRVLEIFKRVEQRVQRSGIDPKRLAAALDAMNSAL